MRLPKEEYEQAKNCLKRYRYNSMLEKENKKRINEYEAVNKALLLLDEDSKFIFKHLYEERDMDKWEIIDNLNFSEETYKRRHRELVYTVYNELKNDPFLT